LNIIQEWDEQDQWWSGFFTA